MMINIRRCSLRAAASFANARSTPPLQPHMMINIRRCSLRAAASFTNARSTPPLQPKMDNQMQKWPFPELKYITKFFSKDRIIAEGDFAAVYKGVTRNEELMAVKKFKEKEYTARSKEQFFSEWSLKKHDNIVQPKAYCAEIVKEEVFSEDEQELVYKNVAARVLCYELLPPERTLHHRLFVQSDQLDWPTCFKIIEGICRGIHHLHEQYEAGVTIHMDIKPWNIVVDADDVPKLGRFGASMRIPTESRGPRECTVQQSMNKMKSDIYNLGILIMEIVTGNMCQGRDNETSTRFYKDKVQKIWTDYHIIAWLYGEYHLEQVKNCIELGIKCVHNDPGKMPTVEDIISSIKPKKNYEGSKWHRAYSSKKRLIFSERDEKRSFPEPTGEAYERAEAVFFRAARRGAARHRLGPRARLPRRTAPHEAKRTVPEKRSCPEPTGETNKITRKGPPEPRGDDSKRGKKRPPDDSDSDRKATSNHIIEDPHSDSDSENSDSDADEEAIRGVIKRENKKRRRGQ